MKIIHSDNRPSKTRYPNLDRGYAPYSHPPDTSNFHPRVSRPARPEDDILHQWRVKRRLESARDVAEHTPANKNSFGFLSKQPDQVKILNIFWFLCHRFKLLWKTLRDIIFFIINLKLLDEMEHIMFVSLFLQILNCSLIFSKKKWSSLNLSSSICQKIFSTDSQSKSWQVI